MPAATYAGTVSMRGSGASSGQLHPIPASTPNTAMTARSARAHVESGAAATRAASPISAAPGTSQRQTLWLNSIHANTP